MEKLQKIYLTYYNFFDSARFIASSLSDLANNLSERIHKVNCKYGHDNKK